MNVAAISRRPHCLVAVLCVGVAAANVARLSLILLAMASAAVAALGAAAGPEARLPLAALALALAGWWWGSARLDALDRSVLLPRVGTAERADVLVTGPPRRARFELRMPARVLRFGLLKPDERVLLELPLGRSPPAQGARLEVLGELVLPHGPEHGFDERTWLRRQGVHVVLRGDRWRVTGRRHGLGAVPDRLHAWLARSVAPGLSGERHALLVGVVLGDDQGLDDTLRQRFRAAGLYHLLAVSGQNVALVAIAVLMSAWLLGIPRVAAEVGALGAMGAYVLAVGPQASVLRAGIAGALGSAAWLTARARDRWYFLLLGALALLVWNPYVVFDAGFELSFAAVVAIFVLVPRLRRFLEGYPVPRWLAEVIAVSTACGVVTAPITWLQFHAVPILTVPANALAAPAVVPLLGLSLATVAVGAFSPGAAAALAWVNGWCAAYLATCARVVGGLPGAQVRSGKAAAVLALCALGGAAYAWRRCRRTT